MNILKSILILILAAALTVGCFWIIDSYPNIFHASNTVNSTTVDVASDLTGRIYGLETEASSDELENYETGVNKEVSAYVHAHSGSSSGGGGSYYYDDDDYYYSGSSGGAYYDDSGEPDGPSGGYWVPVYEDETEYNYCQDCHRWYEGLGYCPYPDCPGRYPNQ